MVPSSTDYQYTEVMTATPQKLQLMLVEAALRHAGQARQHLAGQQFEAAHNALIRSQSILAELLGSLNPSSGDETVARVIGVYSFVYRSLIAANIERSEAKLNDALRVLMVERETWRLVCDRLGSRSEQTAVAVGASFEA
jgi:flagellar protein FliS